MPHYRSIFVSDLHLGTKHANAEAFLHFLKENSCDTLYLVGDLIDGWALSKKWYWPPTHNLVVQKLLRLARRGTRVVYLPGNHDEFVRQFLDHELDLGGIEITNEVIHTAADGKTYAVSHGDAFDGPLSKFSGLSKLGSVCYQWLLDLNLLFNGARRRLGLPYWSISHHIKLQTKKAVAFVAKFEELTVEYAKDRKTDGVICGHIHFPADKWCGDVRYLNTGCWVEMGSAVVEQQDGTMQILHII